MSVAPQAAALAMAVSILSGGGSSSAAYNNDVRSMTSAWGGGSIGVCQEHQLDGDNACIGETADCAPQVMYARDYTDEYGLLMLVAMQVNQHGAKFCPIQIEGKNKDSGPAWTEYAEAGKNCLWLCKDGFTGDECRQSVSSSLKSCDNTILGPSNYSHIKRIQSGTNIEGRVARFERDKKNGCGVHETQEHDMILVVSRWLPSGHGAWVQQMVVRARRKGWSPMISWAAIYPATGADQILTCKNGYKANAAGDDCEPVDWALCEKGAAFCSGWSVSGFDENTMAMELDSANNCYQYRCIENGYAFGSGVSRRCVPCTTNMRGGVSPADGTCVACALGSLFNADAAATGYCSAAISYNRQEMLYGRGQTKATNPTFDNQCWPIFDIDEYRACVENGGRTQKTKDEKIVENPITVPPVAPVDKVIVNTPPADTGGSSGSGTTNSNSGGGGGISGGGGGGNKFNQPGQDVREIPGRFQDQRDVSIL